MPRNSTKEPFFGFMSYPADWYAFTTGPYCFLKEVAPDRRSDQKRAVEYFFLGLTGAIALSALNLSFSGWQSTENLRTLKSETVNTVLLIGSATIAVIGVVLSRLMGGKGSLRDTLVMFGYTLGFLWPTATAALIVISRATSAALGLDWTALPPFDTAIRGSVSPTISNIAWGALSGAVLIWTIGYLLYCYAAAFRASQGIGLWQALSASLLAVIATNVLRPSLIVVADAIGEHFGPLIEWLLKIL
jgi:hypothetical protein